MTESHSELKIVFVGDTGVGKSTIGPMIARRLNMPFVDIDKVFLALDDGNNTAPARSRAIERFLSLPRVLIGTGYVDYLEDARQIIDSQSISVWIKAITDGREGITTLPGTPYSSLKGPERDAIYRGADIHCDIGRADIHSGAAHVMDAIQRHLAGRSGSQTVNWSGLSPVKPAAGWIKRARSLIDFLKSQPNRSDEFLRADVVGFHANVVLESFVLLFASQVEGFTGIWHSEGSRTVIQCLDRAFPLIELFFFHHPGSPQRISARVHRAYDRAERYSWDSGLTQEDEIRRDLAEQLAGWIEEPAPDMARLFCALWALDEGSTEKTNRRLGDRDPNFPYRASHDASVVQPAPEESDPL